MAFNILAIFKKPFQLAGSRSVVKPPIVYVAITH